MTAGPMSKNPAPPPSPATTRILSMCAVVLLVLLAYGNHFQNPFHFDDTHAITDNAYIRDLHNVALFFTDGRTSSVLPPNRTYRPVVTTSLAVDYRLGGGLKPLWFHISTFFWFLIQLGLMFVLFRAVLDRARPSEAGWTSGANLWVALFAAALYGVHPATAETVNYIVQRADLYSTLGVVAGLVLYIEFPNLRTTGLYLLPVVLGILSKASAAVFPALLFTWIWLFDEEALLPALRRSLPAFLVSGFAGWFVAWMTPSTYVTGASSAWAYRMTQPAVLMGYFRKFFLPLDLSADTDRVAASNFFTVDVIEGILFVAALLGLAWWCKSRRELRPIAFGLAWFLIASIPTSAVALAEVENDHRMYMPFVGLTVSVCQAAALFLERKPIPARIFAPLCALILAGSAWGARERNKVWSSDESLWHDVTVKSPNNGRGLMNYGLTQIAQGRTQVALDYFLRAAALNPNYYFLEINLGIAYSTLGNAAEGQKHFERAIQLAPEEVSPHYYYARWLVSANRRPEAIAQLELAERANPDYLNARYLLMESYSASGDQAGVRREAQDILVRFPGDPTAAEWLGRADKAAQAATPASATASDTMADAYLAQSLAFYRAEKFQECIVAAQEALKLKPDYAEAWNNIGAAYNRMSQWDQAIAAERAAIRLKPDLAIAMNNLMVAVQGKQKMQSGVAHP